ncbi:MAG TPA: ATP-binding protein [Micromonosporaceae bacterium]
MTTLTVEHQARFPVAVVRLYGLLDRHTAQVAREAMLEPLADQPSALVVDLRRVRVSNEITLVLFAAVAARAARWPGTHLLLVAPASGIGGALARRAVSRHLTVYEPMEAALAAARNFPVPRRVTLHLHPTVYAAASARAFVLAACERCDVPPATRDLAELVISELVGNAVRHAATPLDVSLLVRGEDLYVSCRDRALGRPVAKTPDVTEERGRGLLLIAAVSSAWGCVPTTDGKIVWARLDTR